MLRWKLFLPLALCFTLLALGGNYLAETKLAGSGIAGIDDPSIADIHLTRQVLAVQLTDPGHLGNSLIALANGKADRQLLGRRLVISGPENLRPIEDDMRLQADLLIVQALATREYWQTAEILKEEAASRGYHARLYVWSNWLVAVVYNESEAYYVGEEVVQWSN